MAEYLSSGKVAKILGVSQDTIRRWDRAGYIKSIKTEGGHRRYSISDIEAYMCKDKKIKIDKVTVGYARVSTRNRVDDLDRQAEVIELFCAKNGWKHKIIKDIGSGINYNKDGLNELIELIEHDKIDRLVINYKDRLLRFGSEIIFKLCQMHNIEVVIISESENKTYEEELVEDVLSIITVFSAKLYGSRSHKNKKVVESSKEIFKAGD